jgi:hypothetical protein
MLNIRRDMEELLKKYPDPRKGGDGQKALWCAHPAYFINHIQNIRPVSYYVEELRKIQDIVMKHPGYQPVSPTNTFCNAATYDVLFATGFHTDEILINSTYPHNTQANAAHENLRKMALEGRVREIEQKEAWQLANAGYTVVAVRYNPTPEESGHLATIRPCEPYSNRKGPVLANVGAKVKNTSVLDVFISEKDKNEVRFYYDPSQSFVFDASKMYLTSYGGYTK